MNRRIVLASRPSADPTPDNFRLESDLPLPEAGPAEMLVKNLYLFGEKLVRLEA